jgi:hypothetical protein
MTDTEDWRGHVAEWRASGLSAEEYCKDRGFTRMRLWSWSSRLLKEERKARGGDDVRMARVVRQSSSKEDGGAVTVQLQDVRVHVRAGVDVATLCTVLQAVDRVRLSRGEKP